MLIVAWLDRISALQIELDTTAASFAQIRENIPIRCYTACDALSGGVERCL